MSLSIGELVGYVGLDTSAAEGAADKLGSFFESKGGAWGKTLAGIGVAAGGLFAAGLASAINMEPSRDRVAAALDLTKDEAERAGKVSGDLFANAWGESAAEVDMAIEAVMSSVKGMRTASEADLRKVTEAALTLSTTMGVDVVRASQVAGNMIVNGLAKTGVGAMDLLGAALSKVPVQLREDVLDATDEYGQFFNALGIKGPQAMALLANGAGKGMYGIDKMGDAIKEFTILATDGSKSSTDALKALGLNSDVVSNKLLAGGPKANKAFGQVVDAILKVKDPSKQAQAALALFGTPLEDLGTKDIPKFLKSLQSGGKGMEGFRGTTERMGKTLNDNAKTNLTTFTRQLQTGLVDLIGGKVLPSLTAWSAVMATKVAPTMAYLQTVAQKLFDYIRGPGAGSFGELAGKVSVHLGEVMTTVRAAVDFLVAFFDSRLGKTAVTIVFSAFTAIFDVITGIVRVIRGVLQVLTGLFTGDWSMMWKGMQTIASGAVKILIGIFGHLWRVVRAAFGAGIGAAKDLVRSGFGWIVDHITGIPRRIAGLAGKFGKAGRDLLQGFIDGMKNAAGIISGIAGNVWNAVKGLLNGAIDKINAALEFTIDLPGPKNLDVNLKNIPHLATGGRATSDTLAVIGDGREPESVLPDSMLRGLLERAHAAGQRSANGSEGGKGDTWNVYQQPGESASQFRERMWFTMHTRPA